MNPPFWKAKALREMSDKEWESVCSKCGICCLHRLKNRKSDVSYFTKIACKHLDLETCLCTVYGSRFQIDRECKKITPDNVALLNWLPKSCGYRTIAEKRDLGWWHPLISGNFSTVHQAGISIKNEGIISDADLVAGDVLRHLLAGQLKIS